VWMLPVHVNGADSSRGERGISATAPLALGLKKRHTSDGR